MKERQTTKQKKKQDHRNIASLSLQLRSYKKDTHDYNNCYELRSRAIKKQEIEREKTMQEIKRKNNRIYSVSKKRISDLFCFIKTLGGGGETENRSE